MIMNVSPPPSFISATYALYATMEYLEPSSSSSYYIIYK